MHPLNSFGRPLFCVGCNAVEIAYVVFTGQSYEIRMLDNRKMGELPEITGKMVKVRNEFWSQSVSQSWRCACNCVLLLSCSLGLLFRSWCLQSIIRVVFHDRRLQYTEHQQLEGWRWNRPGDRILDLGEIMFHVCYLNLSVIVQEKMESFLFLLRFSLTTGNKLASIS